MCAYNFVRLCHVVLNVALLLEREKKTIQNTQTSFHPITFVVVNFNRHVLKPKNLVILYCYLKRTCFTSLSLHFCSVGCVRVRVSVVIKRKPLLCRPAHWMQCNLFFFVKREIYKSNDTRNYI